MALVATTIANDGVMLSPFVVREVRTPDPFGGPATVIATYDSPGRRQVVSALTAEQVRAVMVDAVHGPLGVPYAGAANVANYGIFGVETAGKTGTAERGGDLPPQGRAPHPASPSRSSLRAPARGPPPRPPSPGR
jgi:peptidoglycan glycosyltransferase